MSYDHWKCTEPDPYADDERPEEEPETCPWCKVRMDDDHHPDCPNFQPLLEGLGEPESPHYEARLDPKVA